MAYLDRNDCVRRVLIRLNRPSTDLAFTVTTTNDVIDDFLTEGQDRLTKLIATYIPDAMVSAPTLLVTADSGKTFTFGTDVDSAAVFPLGHFSLFRTLEDIPDTPMDSGVDYVLEGTRIRITGNTSLSPAPYAQTVNASNVISSSSQPTIPVLCRLAMVEDAAASCARRLNQDDSDYQTAFNERWMEVLAAVRTQADRKGGATLSQRPRTYLRGR